MNTADYIVKKIEELGVNEFFGVPGDYNFNILYSIQNNSSTNWVGCTNELNAGYAADGYARVRGYGALVTTYGVGELSALNAVAGANAENIPIVHIVGLPDTKLIDEKTLIHHNFQNVDYTAFVNAAKSVTASVAILSRDNAKMEIDRSFKVLVKEKRPIYIAVPSDVAQLEISDRYVENEWNSDKDKLNEISDIIAEKINNSEKPVIIGDILVKRFDALIEFKEFAAKSRIPVTNFLMGANLIDSDYDKYIGGYFGKIRNSIAENYVNESDCIISVGAIYSDLNSFGQKLPRNINKDIAIYGTYTYVDGIRYDDIKMSELLENITAKIAEKDINVERPNIGYKPETAGNERLTSEYIYSRLQEFFKENDIVFAETGTIPCGIGFMKFPNNVNVQSQILWGSIGWATPAAFGANLAKPQNRVVLITGDGAHLMSSMEIGNMIKHDIKPIIILINNEGYLIERFLSKKPENEMNEIVKINYAKFARSFAGDIWTTKAETKEDFDKALKVTQIMKKMCYIEACTEKFDLQPFMQDFLSDLSGVPVEQNFVHETIDNEPKFVEKNENTNIGNTVSKQDFSTSAYETIVHQSLRKDVLEDSTDE